MLTHKQFLTAVDYPGLMSPTRDGPFLSFFPGVPYHYGSSVSWTFGNLGILREAQEYKDRLGIRSLPGLFYLAESLALNSFLIFFFPLFALLVFRVTALRRLFGTDVAVKVSI